ncbi:MAG: hypothetical protein HC801_01165 [Nitrospira sp.]|nr:hypothetical protein [Nitrospira sp.]
MEDTVTAAYSEGQFSLTGSGILTRVRRYWLNILLEILLTGSTSLLFFVDSVAQVIKSAPPTCPGIALTFDLCPVRNGPGCPPYGEYNDVTVALANMLGLRFIQWNIESGDPDPTLSPDQILTRVANRAKPGSIVVFHANGKGKQTKQVIEQLTMDIHPRKGLKPLTISELLNCTSPNP